MIGPDCACWPLCWFCCNCCWPAGKVLTCCLDNCNWMWLLLNSCSCVGWKFSCLSKAPLCCAMNAGCWSGGSIAIFCLNSKTIFFCSSVSCVIAADCAAAAEAAVAAADTAAAGGADGADADWPGADWAVAVVTPVAEVGVVVQVVVDPEGGKEITWLPTVWVYLIGVDLVTVTFGTGIDLEMGGCWNWIEI